MLSQEQQAYELIFRALSTGSKIKLTDTHVYISSNDLSAESIELLFTKPKSFKNAVGKYIFVPENKPRNLHSDFSLPDNLLSRSQIQTLPSNFLEALFSKKILQESNLLNLNQDALQEVDGTLILYLEDYEDIKDLWEARINLLRKVLQIAGPEGIAEVFKTGQPILLKANGDIKKSEISDNIDNIIGVKLIENDLGAKSAIFYLNKQYLTSMILAPEITRIVPELTDKYKHIIKIDKKQFVDYMSKIFGEIVIPPQSPGSVRPIIIPKIITKALEKKNIYSFIIDRSTSLSKVFEEYKQQLIHLIKNLVENIKISSSDYINSQDLIRIVFFDKQFIFRDFPVTQAIQDIKSLTQYIADMPLGRSTLLHGTITSQIEDMLQLCAADSCNANILIFTDGQDTDSSVEQKKLLQQQGDAFREHKTNTIPKFHIFRVGTADVPSIDEISKGIDAQIHDIKNVANLGKVLENLQEIPSYRDLVQFMQQDVNAVPVYENQLTVGPQLDLYKELKYNGITYTLEESKTYEPNFSWEMYRLQTLSTLNNLEQEFSKLELAKLHEVHQINKLTNGVVNAESKYFKNYFSYLAECQEAIGKYKSLLSHGHLFKVKNEMSKENITFEELKDELEVLPDELASLGSKLDYRLKTFNKILSENDPLSRNKLQRIDDEHNRMLQATQAETARLTGSWLYGYNKEQCPAMQLSLLPEATSCSIFAGSNLKLGS